MHTPRLGFVLLLASGASFGKAQQPFPTYPEGPAWNVVHSFWPTYWTDTFQYTGTMAVCGQEYSVLPYGSNDTAYFRNEGQRTLFRRGSHCPDKEYVIYDFSLEQGDSIFVGVNGDEFPADTSLFVVDTIETITVSMVERRRFKMAFDPCTNEMLGNPFYRWMYWLEGIGSEMHPFYPLPCLCDVCEEGYSLLCYDSLGVQLYQSGSSCNLTNVGIDEALNSAESEFRVSRLPNGQMDLVYPSGFDHGTLQVVDAAGRSVLSLHVASPIPTINDLELLAPGVLIAQLIDARGGRWSCRWLNTP